MKSEIDIMELDNQYTDFPFKIGTHSSLFGVPNNGDPLDSLYNLQKVPTLSYFLNNYKNTSQVNESQYFPDKINEDDFE